MMVPPLVVLAGALGFWLTQSMVPIGLVMISVPICLYVIHVKTTLVAATRESVRTSRIVAVALCFLALSVALAFKYFYRT